MRKFLWAVLALALATETLTAGFGVASARAAGTSAGGLLVSVAYAEDKETNNPDPAAFPVPWQGSPNTIFLGDALVGSTQCGALATCFDAGAIRLDNPTGAAIAVSDVSVDDHSSLAGGKVFDPWGSFSVPAGQSVILTQNPPGNDPASDNFDTSSYPGNQCTPLTVAPKVTITVGGVPTTLVDSGHVLDTGGIDTGYCGTGADKNESIQWRPIGAAGSTTATLNLTPGTVTEQVGGTATETATLLDGGGNGLANVAVAFNIVSGPNAGKTAGATTDAAGRATFSYPDFAAGTDILAASVTTVGTFTTQAIVTWGIGTTPTWTGQDIGTPPIPGSDARAGSVWTVAGSGRDIGGTSDQFHYVWQPLAANGEIDARVLTQTNTNSRARAGVMLRQNVDPASPFYAAVVTPGAGVWVIDRASYGGSVVTLATVSGTVPAYLRIDRSGGAMAASTSPDGSTWTPIPGSSTTFGVGGALLAGLAVTSHSTTQLCTATFDSVHLVGAAPSPTSAPTASPAPNPTAAPTAAPTVSSTPTPSPTGTASPTTTAGTGLPSPWLDTDVGAPAPAGSATFSGGAYTVKGSGADIFGTSDQFNYVYQPTTGNGTLIARVTSQSNTGSSNSKAGVIWKASTAAGSPYILIETGPTGVVKVQYNFNGSVSGATYSFPNVWMKLVRSGSNFSAYTSADGVTWTAVLSKSLPTIPAASTVGVVECSHKVGVLGTATFDNLSFTPGP
jgi:hypothetical protein